MKTLPLILLLVGATVGGSLLGGWVTPTASQARAAGASPAAVAAPPAPAAPPKAATPADTSKAAGPADTSKAAGPAASYRTIVWDDLAPADWDPMKQFHDLKLGALTDADPRATALLQRMREVWDNAPANRALDGQAVRIAGYLVPLDEGKAGLVNFLLVPYFGACIHTPPPPSNQVIDVTPRSPAKGYHAMDPVWVRGRLQVNRSDTLLGVSSYRMEALSVEPYTP
jgi:hypothetical protein